LRTGLSKWEAESDVLQKELARVKGSLAKHASPLSGKCSQQRPTIVSKETYYSVERDLL
jgi:hypothetical protein